MYRRFKQTIKVGKRKQEEPQQEPEQQPEQPLEKSRPDEQELHGKKQQKEQKDLSVSSELLEEIDRQYVEQLKDYEIYKELKKNEDVINYLFAECSDFGIRKFRIQDGPEAILLFVDGLVDTGAVNAVVKALMIDEGDADLIERISMNTLPASQLKQVANYADLLIGVLSGDTGLLVQGNDEALLIGIRSAQTRSVAEPETESVVRGPREGFVENIRTNTSMIRRKLKTPALKMKPLLLGTRSNTNIVVSYLEGVADPAMVEEVVGRLEKIKIDAVLESGYLEELIQDSTVSPFPQVQYTERPDTVAAALLEGRVAILTDGTPFVLIVPTTFWQLMQANEDYYERFQLATLIRWLRYVFVILSLTTPSLYIAITTFHQAMIPTTLLLSIASAREPIPFPAVVEAFIMEIAFEALREAGVRLPKAVGQTVSILGALVVGQAAVQAGIVSATMVIIVSITGIASFTVPRYNAAITFRLLRFPLMIIASMFGMYGILIGLMLIVGHMANLRSFGVPYLSPTGPLSGSDLKDVLVRAPWQAMGKRPAFLDLQNKDRIGDGMREELREQRGQKGMDIEHAAPTAKKEGEERP
ncbi:MAG TPA: spore germination protein [Bacilli bacterium]|nr:spore germination protein [Bacilli bacterium]